MSIEYLEDLAQKVDNGANIYACPSQQSSKWYVSSDLADLKIKAQRAADARRIDVCIYRLVNNMDTLNTDSFLIVTKILEPGMRGEPNFTWSLVDTREAAEMLRDVSQGPAPFFGAVTEDCFKPRFEE
jgi:hypothetical protein